MANRKKSTLHRKQNIEQHEPHVKLCLNSNAPEG